MATNWRILSPIGGAALAALLLGACGGDTPEAVQESLSQAAPALAFADESHADCVSTVLLDTVGFESLAQDGHTSTSLTEQPDSIVEIVAAYDSDELRTALTSCLDVDAMFRHQLAAHNNDEAIVCRQAFEPGIGLVDEFLQQQFDGEEISLTFTDDDDTRDLLRPCLDEQSFGSMFNIDDPDELGAAVLAALPPGLLAQPCAAEALVGAIGAEELNDVGITIEDATIDLDALYALVQDRPEVTVDAVKAIEAELSSALIECNTLSDSKRIELFNSQPLTGACGIDAVESEWIDAVIDAELGRGSVTQPNGLLRKAFDDCALERAEQRSGIVLSEASALEARRFSDLFYADIRHFSVEEVTATPQMLDCAFYVAVATMGVDEMERLHEETFSAQSEEQFMAAYLQIVSAVGNGRYTCEDTRLYLLSDMQRIGFSEETLECVADGASSLEDLAHLHLLVTTGETSSETEYRFYFAEVHSLLDRLEQCHTIAEQSLYTDYLDAIGLGTGLGEPDTSSA